MNKTEIIVRDFKLPARIGIYEEEHLKTQEICVDVTMELQDYRILHDQIDDTVSYEGVVSEIRRLSTIHHNLVETFAENLANYSLQDPRVQRVTVSLLKTEIFAEGAVGCALTRYQKT